MNPFSQSVTSLIRKRFSCRAYLEKPIPMQTQQELREALSGIHTGPLAECTSQWTEKNSQSVNTTRFELIAATEEDRRALRGLGTYGFIRGATGFIVGAVQAEPSMERAQSTHASQHDPRSQRSQICRNLEDFGYLMECIILKATDLNLGTCWLGGTFTQSSFARKLSTSQERPTPEIIPAVAAVGLMADQERARRTALRQQLGADHRKPWEELFFRSTELDQSAEGSLPAERSSQSTEVVRSVSQHPLSPEEAGDFAAPLEMVRLAPSASNKQPWRIFQEWDDQRGTVAWHFYLQRTPNYGKGSFTYRVLRLADLQRVDLGIAMCHFELTARELGLPGNWEVNHPHLPLPNPLIEYVASWKVLAPDGSMTLTSGL